MECPKCGNKDIVKNGTIHNGKQKYACKLCRRQFVENPENKIISQATKDMIDKMLLEKIPLAGIARVTEVSEYWLQSYVNNKYESIPRKVKVKDKKKGIWKFNVMSCGLLLGIKLISNGYG